MTQTTLTPLSPEVLRERTESGAAVVIDVRTPAEFAVEHIAGSYNVPLDTLKEHTGDVAARLPGDVVLVCASGMRATDARERLAAAGFTQADVLAGGISSYAKAGGDVVRRAGGWVMERQVRMTAGSLVLVGALAAQVGSRRLALLSAGVGGGLVFSALSNTCAMGSVLDRMPWNRRGRERPAAEVLRDIPSRDARRA